MLFHTTKSFTVEYPLEEADVVFLGIPSSEGSVSSTSNYGPLIVREALKQMEDFCDGKNIFAELKVCDVGDIEVVPGSYELTAERIRDSIEEIKSLNQKAFIVAVGGNHLVTLPLAQALKPKTIVQFDAHSDTRSDFLGNQYMQQTWGYHAVKQGIKLVQVGVRSWNKEEKEFAEKHGVTLFSVQEFLQAFSQSQLKLELPIHMTIDIDVFDPPYVVTGLPEPNGAKPEEIFSALRMLMQNSAVGSMDIVEIADSTLPSQTGALAARLIKAALAATGLRLPKA